MRALMLLSCSFAFVACAGPRYAERGPIHPVPAEPVAQPPAAPQAPVTTSGDNPATQAWLDQEIDHNRYVPPPPPPPPEPKVRERVVERPVYVDRTVYAYDGPYYRPYYYYGSYESRPTHTTFPLNTAIGAGLGAIIGHQSGHRTRGAWIGGGLGLLVDLSSRW